MIRIPGTAAYNFVSSNNCIEGDQLPEAVGVQMPWQRHPSRGLGAGLLLASPLCKINKSMPHAPSPADIPNQWTTT